MSYTMYKHHLTVIVWPAVKQPQQWFTSAGTYISHLYRRELFFLVDGNKVDHPSSNKVAICGVRPTDTMQSVSASSVAASLGIRTLLRSCSVTRCPGYNALTLVTRIVATACSCAKHHTIPWPETGYCGEVSYLISDNRCRYFGQLRRIMGHGMAVHHSPIVRSRMKQMCNPLWSFSKSTTGRIF